MSLVLLVSIGYRVKMWLSVFHPAKKILSYKLYILLSFSILSYTILYLNQACFGLHVFTFCFQFGSHIVIFFLPRFLNFIEKFHSIYPCVRKIVYVILKTKYVCYFSIISPPLFNNNSMIFNYLNIYNINLVSPLFRI